MSLLGEVRSGVGGGMCLGGRDFGETEVVLYFIC